MDSTWSEEGALADMKNRLEKLRVDQSRQITKGMVECFCHNISLVPLCFFPSLFLSVICLLIHSFNLSSFLSFNSFLHLFFRLLFFFLFSFHLSSPSNQGKLSVKLLVLKSKHFYPTSRTSYQRTEQTQTYLSPLCSYLCIQRLQEQETKGKS